MCFFKARAREKAFKKAREKDYQRRLTLRADLIAIDAENELNTQLKAMEEALSKVTKAELNHVFPLADRQQTK
jgi:hypothetical protein